MIVRRRSLIAAAAATALFPGIAAHAQGGGELIIATTGGPMTGSLQAHFCKRFEAETGIRIRAVAIELPDQWARAVAGARTGTVPFDVVTATPPDLIQQAEILQALDSKGIVRRVGGMALTWSKKAFPNGSPQSWTDFFDTAKFPGPRSLPDTGDREWWVPLAALMADGVPRDKLFPMDLDRAYKNLDTIKKTFAAWRKSGDDAMQILRGGDAVMSMLCSDSNNKEAAAQVPEAERRFRPSFPASYEKLVIADYRWIAGERAQMRERWVTWLTA